MAMRLSQRICSMNWVQPHGLTRGADALFSLATLDKEMITNSTNIVIDNVAEFYWKHSKVEWDLTKDFPNCAPPFGPSFFMEWTHPNGMITTTEGPREFKGFLQYGMCVYVLDAKSALDEVSRYPNRGPEMTIGSLLVGVNNDETREKLLREPDLKWCLSCRVWTATSSSNGLPVPIGSLYGVWVDSSGTPKHWLQANPFLDSTLLPGTNDELINAFLTMMHPPLLALSFMHCKNVAIRDATNEFSLPEKTARQHKIPKISYRVLEINPMKEVLRTEGRSETNGIQKALHICRGHFRSYGEDSGGLFGKYHGQFWIPSHARGKADNGVVLKDYSVKPGELP